MEQGRAGMPGDGTNPLTGFSHGAAGMAWALLELATLTGEERFRKAAVAAITRCVTGCWVIWNFFYKRVKRLIIQLGILQLLVLLPVS